MKLHVVKLSYFHFKGAERGPGRLQTPAASGKERGRGSRGPEPAAAANYPPGGLLMRRRRAEGAEEGHGHEDGAWPGGWHTVHVVSSAGVSPARVSRGGRGPGR
ncbi:hypothetical protein NDU88_000679 [Pleurodeles waltl]|uniref:Uncharacterized protein n=1 Tax=Pleurodeles waltl TaxID=8319 RepID=A0AAV7Q4W2_PLEWA|nr:hypothetical protein NDU88_000679 [Pleurodeles waltl]